MLRADGHVGNRKRTYRIYCEEGLQVHTKRHKKLFRPRVPMVVPSAPNERWSVDFVSDQLANGRRFRVFNVVDDYSREAILQVVDFSISGARLARELDQLAQRRPLPERIVMDNGPEFTSKAMFFFREYCLNLQWFASLEDPRSTVASWRHHYNYERPHRSLGKMPPAVFAREAA